MLQHVVDKKEPAQQLAIVLKNATNIVSKTRQIELALASISMASILIEKPRPGDFKNQLSQTLKFVTTNCKSKMAQLPKYVQTLYAAETAASTAVAVGTGNSEKQQSNGASSSAASTAATASASLVSVSEETPLKQLRKKTKLQ